MEAFARLEVPATKRISEVEYLVHGNPGKEFYALLRKIMPDWESRKARLESIMAN